MKARYRGLAKNGAQVLKKLMLSGEGAGEQGVVLQHRAQQVAVAALAQGAAISAHATARAATQHKARYRTSPTRTAQTMPADG